MVTRLDTCLVLHTLAGHESIITSVSIRQPAQDMALTVSASEAFMWDLNSMRKIQQLSAEGKNEHFCEVNMMHVFPYLCSLKAFFLPPMGTRILTALRGGAVFIWDAKTFDCCFEFEMNPRVVSADYQCFCCSE